MPNPYTLKTPNLYDTLSQAIADLQSQGYTENLTFCEAGLENRQKACVYPAAELHVRHFFRFEGQTNPDDSSILYAIETSDGHKGLLVDAYGAYSGSIPPEILKKLKIDR